VEALALSRRADSFSLAAHLQEHAMTPDIPKLVADLRNNLRNDPGTINTLIERKLIMQAIQAIEQMAENDARLTTVHRFLLGEGPLDGAWFGERPAGKPQYWWRNELRAARAAQEKQHE
jgi:hypothetical protein